MHKRTHGCCVWAARLSGVGCQGGSCLRRGSGGCIFLCCHASCAVRRKPPASSALFSAPSLHTRTISPPNMQFMSEFNSHSLWKEHIANKTGSKGSTRYWIITRPKSTDLEADSFLTTMENKRGGEQQQRHADAPSVSEGFICFTHLCSAAFILLAGKLRGTDKPN